MASTKRVVVTGYGAICSLGENSSEIWSNILDKKIGYRIHEFADKRIKAKFYGFMDTNKSRYKGYPKGLIRRLPEFARLSLVAASEAVTMAFSGVSPSDIYSPFDCGVIVGTGWGGMDTVNENNNEYVRTQFGGPYTTIQSMNNAGTAGISMHFKLRGYQSTPIAACASGGIAIGEALQVIRRGDALCMLAGGSESLKEQFNVWSVDVLEALSKEPTDPVKACCPFGMGRSGFVLSEGAAVLCLEEFESAVRRGAKIFAEVSGYGNSTDAFDFTAPAPDAQGRVQSMRRTLASAGILPDEIDYVNAHGTSTQLNDYNESQSIKEALGSWASKVKISSTKSYTGHLIGAAGAIESIFCIKAIEQNVIPATINLTEPDPLCDLDFTPNEHVMQAKIDRCLNLSFGFGGANSGLIINRVVS